MTETNKKTDQSLNTEAPHTDASPAATETPCETKTLTEEEAKEARLEAAAHAACQIDMGDD